MRPLILAVLLAAPSAQAVDVAVNAGALEVVAFPGPVHGGFYPNLGVSLAFPTQHVTFIAALSFEWSFEMARGGFVLVGTADFPVAEHVGLDANVALIHDQPGLRFNEAVFFVGAGPGVSFFVWKFAFSPYVNFFVGGSPLGFSIVPGVNVAYTF